MAASGPTVFLVVHQGFAARYLLRTGLFGALRAAGARIVIVTPNADEAYLREEFPADDVAIEPLRADVALTQRSRLWSLLYHLRTHTLGAARSSEAFVTKYDRFRRRLRAQRSLARRPLHVAISLMWSSAALRRAVLALETRLFTPPLHADLFERHRPDLVVTTSPGYFLPDALLLREARARGVKGVAVVAAWDNPSSKGYRGADPDLVVAWSDRMARQLEIHQELPPERIFVEGVPHFDRYVRPGALWSREETCRRLGLDPARKTIVLATSTPGAYAHSLDLAEGLAASIADGRLHDGQLVVRLHPIYFRADHQAPLRELEALQSRHRHVHVDVPEVQSTRLRCDLPESDNQRFSSLLATCDALVCMFSTTALEAFLADRPVVFATWTAHLLDLDEERELVDPEGMPQRPWEEFAHLRELVDTGAVRVGRTLPEVVAHTRAYLDDPSLESEERRRIARAECGPTDGQSGERIAARLLELAGHAPSPPGLDPTAVLARSE